MDASPILSRNSLKPGDMTAINYSCSIVDVVPTFSPPWVDQAWLGRVEAAPHRGAMEHLAVRSAPLPTSTEATRPLFV